MIEFLPLVLTGLGLTASIVYYANVLRNANKTRRTQMLMELYQAYRDPQFALAWGEMMNQEYTDFEDFWQKYGSETNREAWNSWQSVARVFNGIGVLLRRGMIDIDLVEELLANIVFISWYKMGLIVIGFRELTATTYEGKGKSNRYEQLSGFEYLYNELNKRDPRT
jgi:hypothetical protein